MTRMSSSPLGITAHWAVLADGLLTQRAALHVAEYAALVEQDAALPDQPGLSAAAYAWPGPSFVDPPSALEWSRYWTELPALLTPAASTASATATETATLRAAAGAAIREALDVDAERTLARSPSLMGLAQASAWWIAIFAVIRHKGVDHRRLAPVASTVSTPTLQDATELIALGVVARAVAALCRAESPEAAFWAEPYARLAAAIVLREQWVPALLDELDELRLVDLVGLTVPWRGQFQKYAGGLGAGQVE